jgi:hypothetical protein
MARIGLNKAATTDSPLGFRLDVGLGETVDRIISVSDYQRNEATKHLLQAYVSYVAPIGKGLTINFGKMYTPIGAEVIDTKDNFNYSRGFLFTYGPYYSHGTCGQDAVNDKVAVTGFLFDGWDNMFENNRNKVAGKTTGVAVEPDADKTVGADADLPRRSGGSARQCAGGLEPGQLASHRRHGGQLCRDRQVHRSLATSLPDRMETMTVSVERGRGSRPGSSTAFNNRFAFSPRLRGAR